MPQPLDGQKLFPQEDGRQQCRGSRRGGPDEGGVAYAGILQAGKLGDIVEGYARQPHEDEQEQAVPPGRERDAAQDGKDEQQQGDAAVPQGGQGGRGQLGHHELDEQRLQTPDETCQRQQTIKATVANVCHLSPLLRDPPDMALRICL